MDSSVVVDEVFEDPSVVVEDIPLLHLVLIDVSSVCLCRMLGFMSKTMIYFMLK